MLVKTCQDTCPYPGGGGQAPPPGGRGSIWDGDEGGNSGLSSLGSWSSPLKPAQSLRGGLSKGGRGGPWSPQYCTLVGVCTWGSVSLGMGGALLLQDQHYGKELALIFPPCPTTHSSSEGWQDIWPCWWVSQAGSPAREGQMEQGGRHHK